MTDESSAAIARWVRDFASEAAHDEMVERAVTRIDAEILGQIPALAADPILVEDLHRSTRAQWRSFALALAQENHRLALPEQAADLARSLARRGLDLGVLLKVYRAASQGVFDLFTEITSSLGSDAPPRDEVLAHIWRRADKWIDESVEALIETYYDERERRLEGALQRKAAAIGALLSDTPPAEDQSPTLGHAVGHWQTGLVVWMPGAASPDTLVAVARRAAELVGAPDPLTLMAGSRDLWCWLATRTAPDLRRLAGLGTQLEESDVRISVGVPATGPSGFRSSHEEALAAQRLVADAAVSPRLLRYPDVEVLCLAAGSPALLHRMVHREVSALCGADKNLGLIRQTVLAYLSHRMSVEAAAEELFVHKNTVRYRLARAEELLGHPLAERAPQIELSLQYVGLFGPPPDSA